ncbi:uncharacterized protein [Anabrus simplex]|uniref:uncharacterized protein isoform X2 n=1 Tax=Anabrus simplex TaxID=316456 RepID=UPI0035A34CDD
MKTHCTYLVALLCAALMDAGEGMTCDSEQLVKCAYPINKELVFVGGKEELDSWCPELKSGLTCIESYTRRCMSAQQREHFHQLYAGTSSVIQELCQEGPYQQEFLRHAPCIRGMKSHYEYCAKAYQRKMQEMSSNDTLPQPDESVQFLPELLAMLTNRRKRKVWHRDSNVH